MSRRFLFAASLLLGLLVVGLDRPGPAHATSDARVVVLPATGIVDGVLAG
ncbi:MAG: hypothetical protein H0U37_06895, partial [Chloroflexi bacterium]|nr:hypothetical protein [Chloroflexota bacterium]